MEEENSGSGGCGAWEGKNMEKINWRRVGGMYEQAAGAYLEQKGYTVLEYNYRCRAGEIDIVAMDGDTLVFCEVKYRSGPEKGNSLEAVDARKQQTIFRCAMFYLAERKMGEIPCRFDVIGIDGTDSPEIVHIEDAFRG